MDDVCGFPYYAFDSYCDDENNNENCNGYDGGACCPGPEAPYGWDDYCTDCRCYCWEERICGECEGYCLKKEDCQSGLECGNSTSCGCTNCCYKPPCSSEYPCGVDEGPCDLDDDGDDDDCKEGLKCGTENCEIEKEIVNCCYDPTS